MTLRWGTGRRPLASSTGALASPALRGRRGAAESSVAGVGTRYERKGTSNEKRLLRPQRCSGSLELAAVFGFVLAKVV